MLLFSLEKYVYLLVVTKEPIMLKRKITQELLAWKKRKNRLPLLVSGARQVGKTHSITQFAKEEYAHVVTINFAQNPQYASIFSGPLEVDEIVKRLSFFVPQARYVPGDTLFFFDEIQESPNARTALKFFALDNRFDVIASGSLLGISYKDETSLPVGYIDHCHMDSLDFEEFLWAYGYDDATFAILKEHLAHMAALPTEIHTRMFELLREYAVLGGMPNVLQHFFDTHNINEAIRVQKNILRDYRADIAKYAEGADKSKARACFDSIPRQLARDYKKFSYSVVEKKAGARKYQGSLQWLYDAGIINFCHNLEAIDLPLEGNVKSNNFKVYTRDTGILLSMLEAGSHRDVLTGNLGIYKGALYENLVADIFAKQERKLYFYGEGAHREIDFVIRDKGEAVPVEVKSSDNKKTKSLSSLLASGKARRGIKLGTNNLGYANTIETIPLYLAPFMLEVRGL